MPTFSLVFTNDKKYTSSYMAIKRILTGE